MNNIPASRKVATAHLLGWQGENLYKEMNLKERKSEEEILLEKKEDAKSGHIKMISAFALLLTSSLLQICC